MTNSFSLTRKTDTGKGHVSLRQVDEEICVHFNIVPHPSDYYHSWFDTIGFDLASGQSFAEIIRRCHDDMEASPQGYRYYERKLEIAEYLDKHFIPDRWSWEVRTIKDSTEEECSAVLAQLVQVLSDPERIEFFAKKLKDRDGVFTEHLAELPLLIDAVFKKYPGLREGYAELFKERFGKLNI